MYIILCDATHYKYDNKICKWLEDPFKLTLLIPSVLYILLRSEIREILIFSVFWLKDAFYQKIRNTVLPTTKILLAIYIDIVYLS